MISPFPYANKDQQIFFCAEIGSNHLRSLSRIQNLIDSAKSIGCDAVKFQYFTGNKLWHSSRPDSIAQAHEREIPYSLLIEASEYARKNNIAFGCSIFHPEDISEVAPLCDFLKISSYDCLRPDLIAICRSIDRPLFISTGMCIESEIINIGQMADPRVDDGFFHCISRYPPVANNIFIPSPFQDCFFAWVARCFYRGYSDHTGSPAVIYSAVAQGYNMFELHFDLEDRRGVESSYGHCWSPTKLDAVISIARAVYKYMQKSIQINQRPDREERINRADVSDGMRPMKGYR